MWLWWTVMGPTNPKKEFTQQWLVITPDPIKEVYPVTGVFFLHLTSWWDPINYERRETYTRNKMYFVDQWPKEEDSVNVS